MIAPGSIEQVFTAADILEVVGDFVSLKKRGTNYIGLCPFHNEKTPSFNVNPARGIFKCFGCGKGGNAVDFVMEHEKYSYPEAIRYLAKKYGIELEETGLKDDPAHKDERENLFALNEYARAFFSETLYSTEEGRDIGLGYFRERGFRDESIRKFQLGYSPDQWEAFTRKALQEGFRGEALETTGLSVKHPEKGSLYDRFRGRVLFPIHNLTGRVIGFGGRVLKTGAKAAKYVNSPESVVYHKSETLYGIFFARNKIRELDNCFLVEGYTDVISLHQSGIENVVASSGTSLTPAQIRLISRYTRNITILYDGDPAGIKASLRGIDMILEEGMNVKVVLFPEGHDPDSFVRKSGGAACSEYIREHQKDFILFKADLLLAETGRDPIRRAEAIGEIVESISRIPDSIKASVFVAEASRMLQIDERALLTELNKLRMKKLRQESRQGKGRTGTLAPGTVQSQGEAAPPEGGNFPNAGIYEQAEAAALSDNDDAQEREIVRLMLNYGNEALNEGLSITQFLVFNLEDVDFGNATVKKILDRIKTSAKQEKPLEPLEFTRHPDEDVRQMAVALLSTPYVISENWQNMHGIFVPPEQELLAQAVLSAIFHLKMRKVMRMIAENQLKLKDAADHEEQVNLQLEHIRLSNIKRELSRELGTVILR
ncbi:MAG TPA: DNA primase [Anseongella sp.]|nr:DNA primase [Anseongella sp.]